MAGKKYYGYHGHAGQRRVAEPSDGLFGWTVFIFILIGIVFLCWMGSYYVFARPEKVANYRLLQRLHKLEPPQRFEITAAPRGEFLKPGELLDRFGSMTAGEIRLNNETLLRNFIRNYRQCRDLVPYAVGNYRVLGAMPLSEKTFCSSGYVALLQAVEQPEILLEQVFTADERNLAALERSLRAGQQIKLEKPLDLSAVIHIDRLPDNRIKLTTMPLLYGTYGSGQGPASFSLTPPEELNLEAGLPILTASMVDQISSGSFVGDHSGQNRGNLVRMQDETPLPTPTPHIEKALPVSQNSNEETTNEKQVARALPVNEEPVLPAIPVGTPVSTPAPVVVTPISTPIPTPAPPTSTPAPVPPPESASQSPVTNSPAPGEVAMTSTNATNTATVPAAWPVYAPGMMPRGELLDASDTQELATHGIGRQHHYLRGRFVVTAAGNGKAVLRPEGILAGLPIGPSSKIRVIVEFPVGDEPPPEGNTISRDALRPFLINAVKREKDGQINVYAREVTREE